MPDTESTLIHFRYLFSPLKSAACGELHGAMNQHPGKVTCFACRNTSEFRQAQAHDTPVKLSGVMADSEEIQALAAEAEARENRMV